MILTSSMKFLDKLDRFPVATYILSSISKFIFFFLYALQILYLSNNFEKVIKGLLILLILIDSITILFLVCRFCQKLDELLSRLKIVLTEVQLSLFLISLNQAQTRQIYVFFMPYYIYFLFLTISISLKIHGSDRVHSSSKKFLDFPEWVPSTYFLLGISSIALKLEHVYPFSWLLILSIKY
jgi:hypothetical protein